MNKGIYLRYIKEFCMKPKYILEYFFLIICILGSASVSALQPKVQAMIIDGAGDKKEIIINYAFFLLFIVWLGTTLNSVKVALAKFIAEDLAERMREKICEKLLILKASFCQQITYSDLLTKSDKDIEEIKECGIAGIIFLISNMVNVIICIPFMLNIDLEIGVISLVFVMLLPVINHLFKKRTERMASQNLAAYKIYNDRLADLLNNWKNIRLFSCNGYVKKRFEISNSSYKKSTTEQIKVYIENDYANSVTQLFGLMFIWILGIKSILAGNLTIGNLIALVNYQATMYAPMSTITSYINELRISRVALKDIYKFWDYEEESLEGEELNRIDVLKINKVAYYYDEGRQGITETSFTFEKGNVYAITGESGIGKSTLLDIIAGLNEEYQGKIIVNGIDKKNYKINRYRKQIGYIQQNTRYFQDSVYNNITLGSKIEKNDIKKSCNSIDILGEIEDMKDGWNTVIRENAENLSMGQAKRIDVARNISRQKSIYIFDETTASIDAVRRTLFYKMMRKLAVNAIVIFVSHNKDELKYADFVYEIKNT